MAQNKACLWIVVTSAMEEFYDPCLSCHRLGTVVSLLPFRKIVADLEDGELSLELSLNKFEEGVKLTKQCQKIIHEAEQKIQIISGENIEKFEVKED